MELELFLTPLRAYPIGNLHNHIIPNCLSGFYLQVSSGIRL